MKIAVLQIAYAKKLTETRAPQNVLADLRAIAKVRRSPAKQTNLVSLETPLPPPKRTKVRTSGFNSQTNMYTKHHLKPKVRFLRKPPPAK